MNAATSLSTSTTIDPLLRPRTVIDNVATRRTASQRAASEGRVEPLTAYATTLPDRASFIAVTGGALAFIAFMLTVPLTVNTYLARTHHGALQMQGWFLAFLILGNLAIAYLATLGHEALHALACRLLGGQPHLAQAGQYGMAWSAPAQGFSRSSYLIVVSLPFVAITVLFAIVLAAAPQLAAFLIASLVVNAFISAADLWIARAVTQTPDKAALFVDTHTGFVSYAIVASKQMKKKTNTTPVGKR